MYVSRRTIFTLITVTLLIGISYFSIIAVHLSQSGKWVYRRMTADYHDSGLSRVPSYGTPGGNDPMGTISAKSQQDQIINLRTNVTTTLQNVTDLSDRYPPLPRPKIHQLPDNLKNLVIMYYIVPKCGSRTFFYLMGKLKEMNPNIADVLALTSAEEESREDRTKQVTKFVAEARKPAFLYVDTHFVKIKYPKNILYISVIRDPMSRFLSQYSFHNFGDNFTAPADDPNWLKNKRATLDDCVKQEKQICSGRWLGRGIHSRFCGTGVVCYQTCPKNYKQGKRNLVQKYNVVGMLEEFEDFLLVLERLVPAIFDGILDLYRHPSTKEFMSKVKTAGKVTPNQETLAKVRSYLQRDYEFYEVAKNKFYQLKNKLGLNTTSGS